MSRWFIEIKANASIHNIHISQLLIDLRRILAGLTTRTLFTITITPLPEEDNK